MSPENVVLLSFKHCTETAFGRTSVSQHASFPACACAFELGGINTLSKASSKK